MTDYNTASENLEAVTRAIKRLKQQGNTDSEGFQELLRQRKHWASILRTVKAGEDSSREASQGRVFDLEDLKVLDPITGEPDKQRKLVGREAIRREDANQRSILSLDLMPYDEKVGRLLDSQKKLDSHVDYANSKNDKEPFVPPMRRPKKKRKK